jgi:hypothetical protein
MSNTVLPSTPAPSSRPSVAIGLLWRGGINLLVCSGIAIWLTVLQHGYFGAALIYSLSIGMLCWLVVDGGRVLVAGVLARRHPERPMHAKGWPGWFWMSVILLLGAPSAYTGGTLIADALTGYTSAMPWRDGWGSHRSGWGSYVFLLLLTFTVAAVTAGFMYARGALLSAKAEAETVRRLAIETQLKLIESQLEPHMLFNTLANLRVLISLDPPRAQAMLDRLISFLRATLGASRAGMHPLQAEFDRLADYLALMGIRMGERLQSSLELPDDLRLQPVPPLLLQPLVENGIKHGLEPKIDGGRIDVRAWAEGERLLISVRDTGIGLAPTDTTAATSGTAFGLSQVRERLAVLYGSAARLTLRAADDPDGGTLACIELPLTLNHADQP